MRRDDAIIFSAGGQDLVSEWLKSYMFRGQADCEAKGKAVARWLSDHNAFKTHSRPISRDELIARGLSGIQALEENQVEQDLFLSVHHSTAHTFTNTTAVKIIENNLGRAYLRVMNIIQQPLQIVQAPTTPAQPPASPAVAPGGTNSRMPRDGA
jgi:hypothetical protein